MSTFSVETRTDNCAIIATVTPEYSPFSDMPDLVDQLEAILSASPRRMTLIFDFTHLNLNMEDFLKSTQDSLKGAGAKIVRHPQAKASIIVSPNKIWHMTAKGLSSAAFGKLRVFAFDTVDEALVYIRQNFCPPLPPPTEDAPPDQDERPAP